MSEPFTRTFHVGWEHLDANGHMANTAYLDVAVTVRMAFMLAGMSEDGSHFSLRNEFYRDDGKLAARVSSSGGWLDLSARRLTAPPEKMLAALSKLARTDDFIVLKSSVQ